MLSKVLFDWSKSMYHLFGVGTKLEPGYSTVLILGGSSNGMGIELCMSLIFEYNIKIINVDTRDLEMLLDIKDAMKLDRNYMFVRCRDFSNINNVMRAMRNVANLDIPVNIFINNVQEGFETVFNRSDNDLVGHQAVLHLQRCVNANLTNVMIATKFFLNNIIPKTKALSNQNVTEFYIINISTILSLQLPDFARHFSSSKAALNQYHDSLASELRAEKSLRSIKTLLVYLPKIENAETWEVLSTLITDVLIQDLLDGKQGDTLLKVNQNLKLKNKTKNKILYNCGYLQHSWL